MRFDLSVASGNVFTEHGAGYVRLGVVEYRDHLIVTTDKIATGWAPGGFDALTAEDFAAVAALEPEVVVFGTGTTLRFPHPRLTRARSRKPPDRRREILHDTRHATPAACRTFNILAAEGRKVAAAILIA